VKAVDEEGEVLEVVDQSRQNKRAALKLIPRLLKKQELFPDELSPISWAHILRRFGSLAWITFMPLADN